MSDITVPSWRARPENPGPNWRMLAVAGGLLGAVALGGAVTWGVSRMGPRTVPLIEPDTRPVKIRPEIPGGLVVPNQDQLVLEPPGVRRAMERSSGVNARLDRGPELPALEQLREQAAPPAPPSQVQAAPPTVPPSALVAEGLPAPVAPMQLPPVAAPASAPAPHVAAPPAAPAARLPQPVVAPLATGRSVVQLGALNSEEAARGEWERLQRKVPELANLQPRIMKLERDGQPTLYRLRIGGLRDTAAARALCEAVRAGSGQCVPVGG